jgi:hypothetical protein
MAMSESPSSREQATRIQAQLGAAESPSRAELLGLGFDALVAQPVAALVDRSALCDAILRGLTQANASLIAERHVLPALERIAAHVEGKGERVRDLLSPAAAQRIAAIVQSGKGPRFGWLQGSVDPDDVRQLIAPIIQQMLLQFTQKLPIPGLASAGGGGGGGGLGGLVGMIGKQVQRSAGQLADVGRTMMGGAIRDFSQSATSEFRVALRERLKSPEGARIVERMRDRIVTHVFGAQLPEVTRDLMYLPRPQIAEVVALVIEHLRDYEPFRELLEAELHAALDELGPRTVQALLAELGLLESTRGLVVGALDPSIRSLAQSPAFGDWLARLLASAEAP